MHYTVRAMSSVAIITFRMKESHSWLQISAKFKKKKIKSKWQFPPLRGAFPYGSLCACFNTICKASSFPHLKKEF